MLKNFKIAKEIAVEFNSNYKFKSVTMYKRYLSC